MSRNFRGSMKELGRAALGRPADWNLRRPGFVRPRVGLGWLGPVAMVISTSVGWYAFDGAVGEDGDVQFGLFVGSASIMLMAWSFVLALRLRSLEPFFGGLDSMYRAHRWAGSIAVLAMFLHTSVEAEIEGGIRGASKSLAEQAQDLAGVGQYMLYTLVAISLIRWVPYRWWRLTHKLLGVPFAFASFHFVTAEKTYANNSPWGWWFLAFIIAGSVAYLFRVIVRDMVLRGSRYKIASINRRGSTTELRLASSGRPMRHRVGQFAVVKVQQRGMTEPHIFTIASGPDEPDLRFFVRDLGDWTARVQKAELEGADVFVEGPYGRFAPFAKSDESALWIAGGVGITPFLSATESLRTHPRADVPRLVYCVRSRADATAIELLKAASEDGRIQLEVFASSEGRRFSRDELIEVLDGQPLDDVHVAVCGPTGLVSHAVAVAQSLGARHVETEGFDIRAGFGPDLSTHLDQLISG